MRFLHTADWHIGKKLNEFSLADEQTDAYQQILKIAETEKVDAIVLAGDLYDRSVPSENAVSQLDSMLVDLNLKRHFPLLAISGNHDSATRLRSGSQWYQATQYYLHTSVAQAFTPIEIQDTQFFLLPYFEPFEVRQYFNDDSIKTVQQAMTAILAKMKTAFKPAMHQVLVAHFFAAGSSRVDSDSDVVVGGLNAIPVDLLADFDYVALGHLHGKDALHEERVRYSGSPVQFSVSEANQQKGVWIVDTDPFQVQFKPLTPARRIVELTASYTELIDPQYYADVDRTAFIAVNLTDREMIPDVLQNLRKIYPYIISLQRTHGQPELQKVAQADPSLDPITLFDKFFTTINDAELTDQQQTWAAEALETVKKGE